LLASSLLMFTEKTVQASSSISIPNQQLAKEAHLQRLVTLEEVGIPLNELLQKVSDRTVRLTCTGESSALKLQLHLKKRPLWSLMAALADLLPGAWVTLDDKSGYRLEMDFMAVARRARWWRLFMQEWERALAAQRAYILQALRSKLAIEQPNDPNREGDPRAEAEAAAEHEFFRMLPAPLQEAIANKLSANFFYGGLGGEMEEGAIVVPFGDLPEQIQEKVRENGSAFFHEKNRGFTWDDVAIRFNNAGKVVTANLILPNGFSTLIAGTTVGMSPDAEALSLDHRWLEARVRQLGKLAPTTWKELVAFHQSRVWQNDPPATKPKPGLPPRRVEVLQWLADKAQIEFVADYYSQLQRPLPDAEKERPLAQPLKAELDYRAAEQDTSWKKRPDNIYLFRNNRWYRDDYLEIPAPMMRRLFALRFAGEQGRAHGDASSVTESEQLKQQMDWDAEAARVLTPWQIGNGLSWFMPDELVMAAAQNSAAIPLPFPFAQDAARILRHYNTVRFYANLNAQARAELMENRLPFAALTPVQQEAAIDLLPILPFLLKGPGPSAVLLGVRPFYQTITIFPGRRPKNYVRKPDIRLVFVLLDRGTAH